jgi:hypothetical protein
MKAKKKLWIVGLSALLGSLAIAAHAVVCYIPEGTANFGDGRTIKFASHFKYVWGMNSGGEEQGLDFQTHGNSECGQGECTMTGNMHRIGVKQTAGTLYPNVESVGLQGRVYRSGTIVQHAPGQFSYWRFSPDELNTWDEAMTGDFTDRPGKLRSLGWQATLACSENTNPDPGGFPNWVQRASQSVDL